MAISLRGSIMERKEAVRKEKKRVFSKKHGLWTLFSVIVLSVLIVGSIKIFWRDSRKAVSEIVAHDIAQLSEIFKRINEECGIIGFEHERNYVDFLTVQSFVGSEIGSMNIAHQKKWQGPYLNDNPTIQEKLYEIVWTEKGYFLVPGRGVVLSNKQVVDERLIHRTTDVFALIKDGVLMHQDKPLAAYIPTIARSA